MLKKDFTIKECGTSNTAFIRDITFLFSSISFNWTSKYVSVKGQIVVKTCQSGNLKHIKYQDVEAEVEEQMQKMPNKKLFATIVSSREKELRSGEDGRTTSSQKTISLQRKQGEGRNKLRNVDGDFTTCMRNNRNNNDDETIRMEDLRGKGGGRLKHRTIDGDVPLCLRKTVKDSNDDSSSKGKKREDKESGEAALRAKRSIVSWTKWRAEAKMCPRSTEKRDDDTKNKEVTFHCTTKKT